MVASTSPTTSGASPRQFHSLTEVTYSSGWGIPRTSDECEQVLSAAAAMEMTPNLRDYLAGFLGVSSHVWTSPRRTRLRLILARAGVEVSPAVLSAVAHTPREEVIDDAVDVLAEAARLDQRVVGALAGRLLIRASSGAMEESDQLASGHAAVRATIARVLGRLRGAGTRDERLRALAGALLDRAAEVRDAAIQALGASGDPVAMSLLEQRRPNEGEAFLLQAIDDAIAELRGE
jgi:hypothetical protein